MITLEQEFMLESWKKDIEHLSEKELKELCAEVLYLLIHTQNTAKRLVRETLESARS